MRFLGSLSRIQEPSAAVSKRPPQVTREASVKTRAAAVTSAPEVSEVRTEAKETLMGLFHF